MGPVSNSSILSIEAISALLDKAETIGLSGDEAPPSTGSKVDQAAKQKLSGVLDQLEQNLMTRSDILECEFAQNPDKNQKMWENIRKKIKKLDKESFTKLDKLIKVIQSDGRKINNACKTLGISVEAVKRDQPDLINVLKEVGTRSFSNLYRDLSGYTPLTYAVATNNVKLVKCLAACGVDLNACDDGGMTPLCYAVGAGSADMVNCLVECGADPNVSNRVFETPLRYAMRKGNADMVSCLAKCGADFNLLDINGYTPLKYAVLESDQNMVKCLVECGADINFIDKNSSTPLKQAILQGNVNVVKLLIKLKVDVNLSEQDGKTPLVYAIMRNQSPEIIKVLETAGADKTYAKEILQRKFLAHVWGIGGTTTIMRPGKTAQAIALGGFHAKFISKQMVDYVRKYFSAVKDVAISQKAQGEIVEALENARSIESLTDDAIISKIRKGKPFIIPGGSQGHAISMVLFQDKLVVCNRGEGRKEQAVEVYRLPASAVTPTIINKLRRLHATTADFNDMIKDLDLELVDTYQQKDQMAPNCTWAGAKSALGALFRMYTDNETGYRIYKSFTQYARERAFMEFLKTSEMEIDDEFFDQIREKALKKKDQAAVQDFLGSSKAAMMKRQEQLKFMHDHF